MFGKKVIPSIDFARIKAAVTPLDAAARYGLAVSRGKQARCPFHDDRHPSMLVDERHFYCFACGAHGDVIDLTSRLLSLSTGDAARRLMSDFGLARTGAPPAPPPPSPAQLEARCRRTLNAYVALMRRRKERYAPSPSGNGPWPALFQQACTALGAAECALDQLDDPDPAARRDAVREMLESGMIRKMELEALRSAQ